MVKTVTTAERDRAILEGLGRPYEVSDMVTRGAEMRQAANKVMRGYSGDNPFLLSLIQWFGEDLTDKQIVGVLNAVRKDLVAEKDKEGGKSIREGVYKIILPDGEKFQVVIEGTVAEFMAPSGNKIPFAAVEGPRVVIFSKYSSSDKMAFVKEALEEQAE